MPTCRWRRPWRLKLAGTAMLEADKAELRDGDRDQDKLKNFIDGEPVDRPRAGPRRCINPATGEAIAEAPLSTKAGRRPRGRGREEGVRGLGGDPAGRARPGAAGAWPT